MVLLLLEALLALCLLLFIVWWTMFSGRKKGELPTEATSELANDPVARTADTPPPQRPDGTHDTRH